MTTPWMNVPRPRAAAAVVLIALAAAGGARAQSTGWDSAITGARELVERGAYRDAEALYASVLDNPAGVTASGRATAFFGRAFAAQQRLLSGDTSGAPVRVESIMNDYAQAQLLDDATYGAAIDNNIGILLKAAGRAGEAVSYFRSAGADAGRNRATFLLNTATNFEALERFDSAASYYGQALNADSTRSDALHGLLRAQLRTDAQLTVRIADRWRADSAHAAVIAAVLPDLLNGGRLTGDDAARAVEILAATLPLARVGLASFALTMRPRLLAAGTRNPPVQDGIAALLEAFQPRGEPYAEPASARWWRSPDARPERRLAWSSVHRWIGDLHYESNRLHVARSFYESSIRDGRRDLNRADIDRGALQPLLLIYTQLSNTEGERELADLTRDVFEAKGVAYQAQDLEQIRQFHLTLASLYSARGQWTGEGAANAEFQIEMLRKASRELEGRTGRPVYVPPDLLEKLAVHYQTTGRAEKANEITTQVRDSYVRRNKNLDAEAAVRRIETGDRELLQARVDPATPTLRTDVQVDVAPRTTTRRIAVRGGITGPVGPVAGARAALIVDGRSRALALGRDGTFSDSIPATTKVVRIRVEATGYRPVEQDVNPRERITIRLVPIRAPDSAMVGASVDPRAGAPAR